MNPCYLFFFSFYRYVSMPGMTQKEEQEDSGELFRSLKFLSFLA